MNSILAAAIGGAIGGGLGALVAAVIEKVRGKPSRAVSWIAIILGIAGARLAPMVLPGPSIEAQLEAADPIFATIHKYYPDVFAQMVSEVKSANVHDRIEIQNKIRPELTKLMVAHSGQMDDGSVSALAGVMLAETEVLQLKNPEACVAILTGGRTKVDMSEALPPDIQKRDRDATSQIIEQVATRPAVAATPLTAEEGKELVLSALKTMTPDDQKIALPLIVQQQSPTNLAQSTAYCRFNRALFATAQAGKPGTLRQLIATK